MNAPNYIAEFLQSPFTGKTDIVKSNGYTKTNYFKAYKEQGKSNLYFTKGKSGVYVIKEKGEIVYVGNSGSNLYKTITRHFQNWDDPTQARITYVDKNLSNYTIMIVFCNKEKAERLERGLICKLQPRDNAQKYNDLCQTSPEVKAVEQVESINYTDIDDLPF